MKKRRNIAAAIVLSSMMAVSTCAFTVTSMTASAGSLYSSDTNANYEAFQLLKGTPGTITDGSGTLGNAQWGSALTDGLPSALLTKLQADTTFGTGTSNKFSTLKDSSNSSPSTPAQFAEVLATLNTTAEKEQFARIIGNSFSSGGIAISTDSSDPTDVVDGYYVIKGSNSTGTTLNLLKVAGDLAITGKTGVPSSAKTVTETDDTTPTTTPDLKVADYDIGDSIPYTLTFTLPDDYASYDTYPLTFTDDMCQGLTWTGAATIHYGASDTDGSSINFISGGTSGYSSGTKWTYSQPDIKTKTNTNNKTLSAGDVITITYNATLNSNAAVNSVGNPNKYNVTYHNNPNIYGSGTPTTSTTPDDTTVVFTYEYIFNKVNGSNNNAPLTGADFILEKNVGGTWKDVTALHTGTGAINPTKTGSTSGSAFSFRGLDAGSYKLTEITTPDGFNTITPIEFTVSATKSGTAVTAISGSGTGLTFTPTFDGSNAKLAADVINNQGATLPSTGGIGTTLFYIIGGTLVAGSIVLLITKKRMHSTEE